MTPCALLLLLAGAPVPAHRPPPPAPVVGSWVMRWSRTEARATFSPDGSYRWGAWSGRWSWDARARILTVHESLDGSTTLAWSAYLGASLSGALVPAGAVPVPVSLRRE